MKGTKKMSISKEKAYELALDIRSSVQDVQLGNVLAEVKRTIAKYRGTTGNEGLAALAWDAFCDSCEGWDVPIRQSNFDAAFPELARELF
jgi:hypothetical protein